MINKLDEKLKAYSNEYFIDEFIKSKPSTEYCKLESKCGVAAGAFRVLLPVWILSIACWSRLSPCWYWVVFLCLLLCLLVDIVFFWKFSRRRTKILSDMACAYLERHSDIKEKLPDCGILRTRKEKKQSVNFIGNVYRAEIVKQYLGQDYSISTLKALKDEIAIKEVEWGLGLISLCSLGALSVALFQWKGFDFQNGWSYAIGGTVILSAIYVIFYFGRLLWLQYKGKKHAILRETLIFMLHDQCEG